MEVKGIAGGVTVIDDFGPSSDGIREDNARAADQIREGKKSGRSLNRVQIRRAGIISRKNSRRHLWTRMA